MTVKQFFKSSTFKCLITLLCVLLVSGVFLTIMNSLLKVTDEERFARAINKIYGKPVTTEAVAVGEQINEDNYHIDEAYLVKDDGNYLVKSTGKGGFDNGTVTCWVVVVVKGGAVSGIEKVVIDSNKNQSYISKINSAFLDGFKANFTPDVPFNANVGFVKTGATMSGNAICRSVNGAVDFVNAKFGNIKEDIFKDKNYTKYIDTANTKGEYDEATATVKFEITTTGAKYKGDNKAGAFTIAIDVDAVTGKITNYNILIDGSTGASFTQKMEKVIKPDDNYIFVGMDLEAVINFLNNGIELEYPGDNKDTPISSGASQSVHQCLYAAAFATENYKILLPAVEEPDGDGETEGGSENE